jgi:hypothetical protein
MFKPAHKKTSNQVWGWFKSGDHNVTGNGATLALNRAETSLRSKISLIKTCQLSQLGDSRQLPDSATFIRQFSYIR